MRRCLQGQELHRAVAAVLARHLRDARHRAWIVGSEARGTALPGADVDVVVEGPDTIDLAELTRIRDALATLATLRAFDLIDLRRASSRFRQEALRDAIPLALHTADGPRVEPPAR